MYKLTAYISSKGPWIKAVTGSIEQRGLRLRHWRFCDVINHCPVLSNTNREISALLTHIFDLFMRILLKFKTMVTDRDCQDKSSLESNTKTKPRNSPFENLRGPF